MLRPNENIEDYDLKMNQEIAKSIKNKVIQKLRRQISNKKYENIFINVGNDYKLAMDGFDKNMPKNTKLLYADGKMGEKISHMKKWLEERHIKIISDVLI